MLARASGFVVLVTLLLAVTAVTGVSAPSGIYRGFYWDTGRPPRDALLVSLSGDAEQLVSDWVESTSRHWKERGEYPGLPARTLVLESIASMIVYGGSMGDEIGICSFSGSARGFFWSQPFVDLLRAYEAGQIELSSEQLSSIAIHEPAGLLAVQCVPKSWVLHVYLASRILPPDLNACQIVVEGKQYVLVRTARDRSDLVEYRDCRFAVTDTTVASLGPVEDDLGLLLLHAKGYAPYVYDTRLEFGLAGDESLDGGDALRLELRDGAVLFLAISLSEGCATVRKTGGDSTSLVGRDRDFTPVQITWSTDE